MKNLLVLFLIFSLSIRANEKIKILVGSPIRQKPRILKEFLNSLKKQNQIFFDLDFMFIDDNIEQESTDLLYDFARLIISANCIIKKNSIDSQEYICDETTHYWKNDIIEKVAENKNIIIKYAIDNHYDYLFLIDSDILINPKTIEHLVTTGKDIISEIFWTSWNAGFSALPQVWLYDTYTQYEIKVNEKVTVEEATKRRDLFLNKLKIPGIYEVGGLGACTLISKNALNAGVNFKKIKNITLWGEDRHFCIRAVVLGFNLFVDTHYPAFHIYRESYLDTQEIENFKKINNLVE